VAGIQDRYLVVDAGDATTAVVGDADPTHDEAAIPPDAESPGDSPGSSNESASGAEAATGVDATSALDA
jgi:hypothetical protein